MGVRKIRFTIGLMAGIALALCVLDPWGNYLDCTVAEAVQPRVLRPMNLTKKAFLPIEKSTARLDSGAFRATTRCVDGSYSRRT